MSTTTDQRDDLNTDELPSAYMLATRDDGRFYPMRFGRFFRDERGQRVGFVQRAQAVAFCWEDQHDRERRSRYS